MLTIASGFFDPTRTPQDVIDGIVATFIGLAILFYIKPRLGIIFNQAPGSSRSSRAFKQAMNEEGWWKEKTNKGALIVTNKRAMQVIEVQARLFKVDVSIKPPKRQVINLTTSELFQLSGWATPARRRSVISGPKHTFSFVTCDPLRPSDFRRWPGLKERPKDKADLRCEYLLFQVRAKHGFTGLGRTTIRRWIVKNQHFEPWPRGKDPFEEYKEYRKPRSGQADEPHPAPALLIQQSANPGPPADEPHPAPAAVIVAAAAVSVFMAIIWVVTGRAVIALLKSISSRTRKLRAEGERWSIL